MSLINEALRKARQAASEHDSKQPESAFRPSKAYPSKRSGRGGALWALLLVAVAAGALGAAAVWLFVVDRQPSEAGTALEVEAQIEAKPTVVITEVSPTPVEAQVVPTDVPVPKPTAVVITQPADPAPATRSEEASLDVVESAPQEATATPYVTESGERVFVMEAQLGDTTLSLGFIVARSNNPFAEINGTEVYVGSEIEGFVVEVIEAEQVILRDNNGPLILRVP